MRKLIALLVVLLVFASGGIASASNTASATATVTWRLPITVTEINAYSFNLVRRAGVDRTVGVTNLSTNSPGFNSLFAYDAPPPAVPGCFRITGDPFATVRVTITLPATIGTMTLSGTAMGNHGTSCHAATAGSIVNNFIAVLNASGETFVTWGISDGTSVGRFIASITLPNLQNASFAGTATVTVNY